MRDLDRFLRSDLADVVAEAAHTPDFAAIEQRAAQRRRTRTVVTAAAAAVLIVLVTLGTSLLGGFDRSAPLPAKDPSPRPTSQPPRSKDPSPRPTRDALSTGHWTPLRPDTSRRVTATSQHLEERFVRSDEADTAYGGIDIRQIDPGDPSHSLSWGFTLRERPQLASTLDPARRILEHGIVFDTDRDGAADCQIGINTDAPEPGQLRVWVKNLRTGVIDEKIGPPYGFPFDFAYPGESAGERPRDVSFFFLTNAPKPCVFPNTAAFYAYASVTDNGRVTEWDYAPDDAWLEIPN